MHRSKNCSIQEDFHDARPRTTTPFFCAQNPHNGHIGIAVCDLDCAGTATRCARTSRRIAAGYGRNAAGYRRNAANIAPVC
jgi:hypothetical protein